MEQTKYEKQKELLKENANQTIRELFERKSVRVFKEEPISSKAKQMILYAASEAPTAGCQQLYTILDITDPNIKEQLAVTCDNQPFIQKRRWSLCFVPTVGNGMRLFKKRAVNQGSREREI